MTSTLVCDLPPPTTVCRCTCVSVFLTRIASPWVSFPRSFRDVVAMENLFLSREPLTRANRFELSMVHSLETRQRPRSKSNTEFSTAATRFYETPPATHSAARAPIPDGGASSEIVRTPARMRESGPKPTTSQPFSKRTRPLRMAFTTSPTYDPGSCSSCLPPTRVSIFGHLNFEKHGVVADWFRVRTNESSNDDAMVSWLPTTLSIVQTADCV